VFTVSDYRATTTNKNCNNVEITTMYKQTCLVEPSPHRDNLINSLLQSWVVHAKISSAETSHVQGW